jgi:hypothetical protein
MNERKKVVTHELVDGNIVFTVLGAGSFTFDPSKCTEETEASALVHGYVQKISDKAAIQRDPKTGRSATPGDKFKRMKELADWLQGGGTWTMRAAAKPSLNRAALFEAIAAVRKVAPEVVASKFAGYEDKVLQTFLTHRDIAAEYASRTASGDSSEVDAMLAGLEE